MIDQFTGIEHNYLILPLSGKQFADMKEMCEKHIPSITCSAVIRKGHPYIVVDYGFGGYLKSTIPLDEVFYSGEKLGDKLKAGDALTVILTDKPQDEVVTISKKKAVFNVALEDLVAFSFIYTPEMEEIYALYSLYQRTKQGEKPNRRTRKPKKA